MLPVRGFDDEERGVFTCGHFHKTSFVCAERIPNVGEYRSSELHLHPVNCGASRNILFGFFFSPFNRGTVFLPTAFPFIFYSTTWNAEGKEHPRHKKYLRWTSSVRKEDKEPRMKRNYMQRLMRNWRIFISAS